MPISPTNNLAKLGISAAHAMRLELADQLFYPIAVNIFNPSQPLMGGGVGNRGGQAQRLSQGGPAGNTGGYTADFNGLEGDPVAVVKTMTSDGPIFTLQKYDGSGILTVEEAALRNTQPRGAALDYSTTARYVVKADGKIYDLLTMAGTEATVVNPTPGSPAPNGPYRHWEVNAPGGSYDPATNIYTPPNPNTITLNHYTRAVGQISFRPKEGASSGAIQEQLTRAQSTLDTMSRLLRSLHDEAKGPFSNIVVR